MKTIEFTDNELQVLTQLIDLAVKAGGLNVAEAATVLAKKISQEIEQSPQFAEPSIAPIEDDEESAEE
jgi:hypothetical protein|tara:strand:- start:8471 stop:8674 length:204 start_codon:yes stop_codon:yes gene_type:complete